MSQQASQTKNKHSVPVPVRIIGLLIVIGVVITGIKAWQKSQIDPNLLKLSGTVEATESDVAPRVAGRIVKMLVDEGDQVKAGQQIAILQADELAARVEQASGAMQANQARLKELEEGSRTERIRAAEADLARAKAVASGAADVQQTIALAHSRANELKASMLTAYTNQQMAQRERDAAYAQLQLVRIGPRSEQIDALKATCSQTATLAKNAEQEAARAEALCTDGVISQQKLDAANTARDAARAAYAVTEAKLREAMAGSRPEDIASANARYEQAVARLQGAQMLAITAKQMYDDRLENLQRLQTARSSTQAAQQQVQAAQAALDLLVNGPSQNDLNAAKGIVQQSGALLNEAQYMRGQIVVVAPFDGVITTKYREVGEVLTPGAAIVRVANLSKLWVRVYAPLTSMGRFKVGDTGQVVTESLPGQQLAATVASISQEPEFTPKNVQTSEQRVKLVYALRLNLPNEMQLLKPGMPVDALLQMQPEVGK